MTKGRTVQPRTAAEAASRGIGHRENRQNRQNRQSSPHARRGRQSSSPSSPQPAAVECAVGGDQAFTLYIGYVHTHIPAKMVFSVFRKLGLGKLLQGDDAIEMIHRSGRDGKRDYQSVKIHFVHPFLRGRDGQKNADMLNHIATLTDGAATSTKENFQLEYQGPRTNSRTGRDEPARYWEVRYWSDTAPTSAKAGNSRPGVTLVHKATRRPAANDGWVAKGKGSRMPTTLDVVVNRYDAAPGGAFSVLADANSPPHSPTYTPLSPPAVVHDDLEVDEVLAAIGTIHDAGLTKAPQFNDDGTLSAADPVDAEMQAAGDLLVAEEQLANEGVGNIPGSAMDPCDLLNVGVPHAYDLANGTTTDVDPETGETVAVGIN